MSENSFYRQIARATRETFQTIERLGFQPLDDDDMNDEGDDPGWHDSRALELPRHIPAVRPPVDCIASVDQAQPRRLAA